MHVFVTAYMLTERDSLPARILPRNGALLIIPPMIMTFGFWGALPAAYSHRAYRTGLFQHDSLISLIFHQGIVYACPPVSKVIS